MNWAFELLGLSPEADVASVKRAYARLLRTTRPDEDPEGFQRLHTAYKMVLASVSARPIVTATVPQASSAPEPAPPPAPPARTQMDAAVRAVPAIDLETLAREVIGAAVQASDGQALSTWLQARQEFWSIQIKQQSGHRVLNELFQQPKPISAECMDALLAFFDLGHVLSGVDPVALRALRIRQRTWWEILPGHHRELARRIGLMWKSQPDVAALGKNIALLQKPRTWPRVLTVALQFGRVREIGRLVHTLLGSGGFDQLPPSIDREHAFFWSRAAAPGLTMTRQRFIIGLLRAALAALLCGSGLLGLLMLGSMGSPPTESEWVSAISTSTSVGTIVFALWPLFACGAWFDQWQGQPEATPSRHPWLRRLAIPGLCGFGLMCHQVGATNLGSWLIVLSFIFAVRKFRRRTTRTNKAAIRVGSMMPAFLFIAVAVARALSQLKDVGDLPFAPVAACATFALAIADLWRHRAYLHARLARH